MEEVIQKTIGWTLLVLGLGIIFWGLLNSYNIFTSATSVPEIFKIDNQLTNSKENIDSSDPQAQVEKMISEQLKNMLPADILPKTLNLIVWSVFAGILFLGGGQIASLGIKLVKK